MDTELQLAVGYVETFGGNGKARSTGDGKRAVKAGIPLPHHVALDKNERWLYFAESGSDRIRRINLQEGTLHNFAETCYSGDEGPCGEAGLYLPLDVAFDSQNHLYICDSGSNRIRKVDRDTGVITTIIGTGQHGLNRDGPALEVNLTWPATMAFDKDNVLYIADTQAHKIRRYDPRTGMVTTIAGHVGDGNFHVVFLVDPALESERKQVEEFYDRLVGRYGAPLAAAWRGPARRCGGWRSLTRATR